MATIDEISTWAHRAILITLYLNKGEMSKQKLNELLYLIYRELENIDSLEDFDFYINMKTKQIEIFTPKMEFSLDDTLKTMVQHELINVYKENIYLTDYGYKAAKAIMNDLEFKDEADTILDIVTQFKDFSEQGLMNLILENLKHSNNL
jgi:hypothetical protein